MTGHKFITTFFILVLLATQVSRGAFYANGDFLKPLKLWKTWYDSGQTLKIKDKEWQEVTNAIGYVLGSADQFNASHDAFFKTGLTQLKQPWQLPKNVHRDQILLIYIDWLDKNPAQLHYSAASGIGLALFEAFPQ